jgi:tRNA uridine 5-carboxymethylaminomethyl modification enzyme
MTAGNPAYFAGGSNCFPVEVSMAFGSAFLSESQFDVIVVGAGHAGIEACLSSSRMGAKTALITSNLARIGYMSCNPSIGGLAKGHMVREIDALGGEMGLAADATCIQFKRLNSRKGPAVRGSRAQCDKDLYVEHMSRILQTTENLSIIGSEAKELIIESGRCVGVKLDDGSVVHAHSVVLTTGTFMRGVMHIGLTQTPGGRVGDKATIGISDQLREYGFVVQRLKTGTPARLRSGSIDFSKTTEQKGDERFFPFSSRSSTKLALPQVSCWLSHTNERTHDVIRANLDKSPMFQGQIEGRGPRYCPSIEDKITRFVDKISHQTFLEPEGLSTDSIYLQGISTSLPEEVQLEFLRTISGLENVDVIRYGYAVEYDFVEPTQIRHSLETRSIPGLFLAGQINGTSGYEEAAAQGFVAGVNAVRLARSEAPFILARDEAYTGVLIDDLVTKGTREPYRMFTSRAEHRLNLREDNTLERLWNRSTELGIIGAEQETRLNGILEKRKQVREQLRTVILTPTAETQAKLEALGTAKLLKPTTAEELLRRHEVCYEDLAGFGIEMDFDISVTEPIEIDVKYAGYIDRERVMIESNRRLENLHLPRDFDYLSVRGLSKEEQEKLLEKQPETLGQASRMSGVNPSAIQALIVHLKSKSVSKWSAGAEAGVRP